MTEPIAGKSRIDPLDEALGKIQRDVQPSRDLWPSISAVLAESPPAAADHSITSSRPWLRIAAALLLVAASSLGTYLIMQRSLQAELMQAQQSAAQKLFEAPLVPAMPASFGGATSLGPEYERARASLDADFQRRVVSLPPATRTKLASDLADLRRAAAEISATLALHPNHPLLQELLLSTYQSELAVLSSVNQVAAATTRETRL